MCFVCDRIEAIRSVKNPFFVKELQTGYVVIGDYQHFKGYTLFLYKQHKTELFHLGDEELALFLKEMTYGAKAVGKAFGAQKMNYELLGNGSSGSHMHWHLFPRRDGDLGEYGNNGRGPVWWYPREKLYSESDRPTEKELAEMRNALLSALNQKN